MECDYCGQMTTEGWFDGDHVLCPECYEAAYQPVATRRGPVKGGRKAGSKATSPLTGPVSR